jgi:hypothetical protein
MAALLSLVVFAQAASLLSEQLHHHSSEHCCALCHIGPLPFLQPAQATNVAPGLSVERIEVSVRFDTPREVRLPSGFSRAPPA